MILGCNFLLNLILGCNFSSFSPGEVYKGSNKLAQRQIIIEEASVSLLVGETGEGRENYYFNHNQQLRIMDGNREDSSPRKVHDEEKLAVEIPETAHQISSGLFCFSFLFI